MLISDVLLAEDSDILREEIKKDLLAIDGVSTVEAVRSVRAARAALEAGKFDVAVLDFDLGDGNALELLAERRRLLRKPGAVAIVITANASRQLERICRRAGADHYFSKLTEWDRLRSAIGSRVSEPSSAAVS